MGTNELISIITLAAVIIGAIVNFTSLINRSETKAAVNAEIKVKLDNIAATMNVMATKQNSVDDTLKDHGERITRVEEKAKSAHHRLDGIEGKKPEEKEG